MSEFSQKFLGPPGDKLFDCGAGKACCVDAYRPFATVYGYTSPGPDLRSAQWVIARSAAEISSLCCRGLRATNPHYLERCPRCFLKSLCEQCPAKSWSETGCLDKPVELLCLSAHAEARWLGLIGSEGNTPGRSGIGSPGLSRL